ncbi:MAG: FAD-binding oxidoreductase [Anaerolineales bacterium]|nr:FAD-binding oxidoreductase [Anaerolineales bacterium]
MSHLPLPLQTLTRLENFGHSLQRVAYVFRPEHTDELPALFAQARQAGLSIGLRGAGRSYGDAALNAGQIILDLRGLTRILAWDAESGIVRVEPGVTIEQLWRHALPFGWWPPVVPGTMFPTLGGCLAANIHGKNNWQAGPIGEHVVEFEATLPNGQTVTCSPQQNAELFYSLIGGMGLLGIFTSITLQLKKVHSAQLRVTGWTQPALAGMLAEVDAYKDEDYIVGWLDATAPGGALGRGQLHRASYQAAEAERPAPSLDLPPSILGIPKAALPPLMAPFVNNLGVGLVNFAKYSANRLLEHHKSYTQSLVEFNFLLDYIPGWERIYGRGGLVQHQSFVPAAAAPSVYRQVLQRCQQHGLPPYLAVLKRHRPDAFLLSHAVDGFSLALDFKVPRQPARLVALARELDAMLLAAGGRYYFAKDALLDGQRARQFLGEQTLSTLKELKQRCDPEGLLQHDLFRRCLAEEAV